MTDVGDEFGLDVGGVFNFMGMLRCAAGDQNGDANAEKQSRRAQQEHQRPGFAVSLCRLLCRFFCCIVLQLEQVVQFM